MIVVNYLAAGALFCIGLYTLLTVRALHNGSTNDYAAYGVIGVIVTLAAMALR